MASTKLGHQNNYDDPYVMPKSGLNVAVRCTSKEQCSLYTSLEENRGEQMYTELDKGLLTSRQYGGLLSDVSLLRTELDASKRKMYIGMFVLGLLYLVTIVVAVWCHVQNQGRDYSHSSSTKEYIDTVSPSTTTMLTRTKHDNSNNGADGRGYRGSSGSVYIRYGKGSCPGNGTELVYSGYVGGSHYTHAGAAVNYLCLPKDPLWGQYDDTYSSGAKLYGGEYEFDYAKSDAKYTKYFGRNIEEKDALCSVCLSSRKALVMIPGRNKCYPGWTLEYSGYLVAGLHLRKAGSEYVCLDGAVESRNGSATSTDGALFYMVEGVCGSLPCPPYVNGREITCVVCTK